MGRRGKLNVYKDFHETTGRLFQVKCFEWLSFLFPDLRDAVDLGEIDKEGIDLYLTDNDSNYLKVFQCKGFEKKFNSRQLAQCKNSINSFIKSNCKTEEYFLIISKEVDGVFYKELIVELDRLTKLKIAKKVYCLTASHFIKYYDSTFQKWFLKKIEESNEALYNSYTTIMESKFYLPSVPYTLQEKEYSYPLNFLFKQCHSNPTETINNSNGPTEGKFFFLISEFGFGKTTLLLNLSHKLFIEGYIPLYLPITLFSNQFFSSTSAFTKEIFRIIMNSELDIRNKFLKFAAESITGLFKNNSKIVLIFDGLDENLQLYNFTALKDFFNSTMLFTSPIIFSFRKSYYEERTSDFELALPKRRKFQDKVFLIEWERKQIIEYIELYQLKNKGNLKKDASIRLDQFKTLIDQDNYNAFYGDIPKRPLFLEMIIRDIISGSIQKRTLSELYSIYFLEKFTRDLNGQFENFAPQRETPPYSIDQLRHILVEIHETAANACIKNESDYSKSDAKIENIVHEKDIRYALIQYNLSLDLSKFLNISVLTPISKRGNMNMRLRFVHKSFMEFFIAKSLFNQIFKDHSTEFSFLPPTFFYNYPASILNFLKSHIETRVKEFGIENVKSQLLFVCQKTGLNRSGVLDYVISEYSLDVKKSEPHNIPNLPF